MGNSMQKVVEQEIWAALPLLVLPIAICSSVKTIQSAHHNKNWVEMLPLICLQLNTVFIWLCAGCVQVGYYRYTISNQYQISGSVFRNAALADLLSFAYLLEPVNIFLYTWTFLPTLESREESQLLKRTYKLYR